jgi:hypothetical protein
MTRSLFYGLLGIGLSTSVLWAQDADRSAWINVADCGASGSRYETTASTTAGSRQATVANAGDFRPGQGLMISGCNVRYTRKSLWGPRAKYAANRPLADEVEVRGYDGTAGSWVVYMLDIAPGPTPRFRWTDDLGRTWHPPMPITYDWQPLSGGTQVRFHKFAWQDGYTVVISARDQLITTIEKVEGNVLTLRDAANRSVKDAVVRHCDDAALQAAVDRAVKEKRNVYVPVGHYRLAHGITVANAAAITLEGQSAVDTVLDLSDGEGVCFTFRYGEEVTLRNFRMLGHMGFDARDQAGVMRTQGGTAVWGFYFKPCAALSVCGTERVLVENCHASRMSQECFYSAGPGRSGTAEPKRYTKALTFLRCSVTDAARNAFNNNDHAENTSVLYCRIVDVGGCSWEGASRFVRFIGNYVRNAGTVAMGNIRSRRKELEVLGSGQHLVADNVFERVCPYGGCMIRAAASATQVSITNNLFVNFGSSAVEITSATGVRDMPAGQAMIRGNIFDMTEVGDKPKARIAVDVSANDVTVSDNQIYVRGRPDPLVTAIRLREPALNINVHDNLIRHCGEGLTAAHCQGRVGEVLDATTFLRKESPQFPPLERRASHCYRGWNLAWLGTGTQPTAFSVIEAFDPETLQFKLRQPHTMKPGDRFEVFPTSGANWTIHDNTIAGCLHPLMLDAYGSETSLVRGNLITRDDATGVTAAVELRGRFNLVGNLFSGFDEKDSAAVIRYADAQGRAAASICRDNRFERCVQSVRDVPSSP